MRVIICRKARSLLLRFLQRVKIMAIWQFSIDFIPKTNLIRYFGEIPKQVDEDLYWKENFTDGVHLPDNYEEFLSQLGEKEKLKWTQNCLNWGDYDDGTHLCIDLQNTELPSVNARFHVGNLDLNFVKVVLQFAKLCDCVLLTKNQNIIEPELSLFIEEMKNSNSYRFCQNPIEYLQSDEVKQINWSVRKKLENNEFDFDS